MSETNLPWEFFGRKIRPTSFGLSLVCLVLVWTDLIKRNDLGNILDNGSPEGLVIGSVALVALSLLWGGFLANKDSLMRWGLLLATGAFAARSAFLLEDRGWDFTPFWISVCVTVIAGGSWILERVTKEPKNGRH